MGYAQCDQIGRFLKVLGDMVSIKSIPNAWCIWVTFEKIGLLFNLASNHFGYEQCDHIWEKLSIGSKFHTCKHRGFLERVHARISIAN